MIYLFPVKKSIYPSLCFQTIGLSQTIRVPHYKPVLSVTSVIFERERYLQFPEQSSLSSMISLISNRFWWYENMPRPRQYLVSLRHFRPEVREDFLTENFQDHFFKH